MYDNDLIRKINHIPKKISLSIFFTKKTFKVALQYLFNAIILLKTVY